jgi:hypothetical protein
MKNSTEPQAAQSRNGVIKIVRTEGRNAASSRTAGRNNWCDSSHSSTLPTLFCRLLTNFFRYDTVFFRETSLENHLNLSS